MYVCKNVAIAYIKFNYFYNIITRNAIKQVFTVFAILVVVVKILKLN